MPCGNTPSSSCPSSGQFHTHLLVAAPSPQLAKLNTDVTALLPLPLQPLHIARLPFLEIPARTSVPCGDIHSSSCRSIWLLCFNFLSHKTTIYATTMCQCCSHHCSHLLLHNLIVPPWMQYLLASHDATWHMSSIFDYWHHQLSSLLTMPHTFIVFLLLAVFEQTLMQMLTQCQQVDVPGDALVSRHHQPLPSATSPIWLFSKFFLKESNKDATVVNFFFYFFLGEQKQYCHGCKCFDMTSKPVPCMQSPMPWNDMQNHGTTQTPVPSQKKMLQHDTKFCREMLWHDMQCHATPQQEEKHGCMVHNTAKCCRTKKNIITGCATLWHAKRK